ncbi:alpha-(1,3)-fucosyltransferase C-like [Anticarsia gemmatalis]|uniref:alpha-(1,3)-fucosyltransferase C-like n=1 Tax=Anticarsia gemmatalis TaxID=129554 RepID=UPI003F759526
MPPRTQAPYLVLFLKQMRSIKFFFLVSCTSFAFSLICVQLATRGQTVNDSLVQEALKNVERDFRYSDVYRNSDYLPNNLKYILLWTQSDFAPFSFLEEGQRSFLKNNCSMINCYVAYNRKFFGRNYTKFDAIAFNGRNMRAHDLPRRRSPHQKYIYFNMESSDYFPICNPVFDEFFNLTATYRLDSDIPIPYILIKDKEGEVVGPKREMQWIKNMDQVGSEFAHIIENKTKAAAWFVSNCGTRSRRQEFVTKLQSALYPYGFTVDVYGDCGTLRCPRNKEADCNFLLKRDYFFYMSLENSFADDYVTEKLLTALKHDVVPVVFGGADYSRFLPPGSYIDGREKDTYQIAAIMDRLAHFPQEYSQYFRWKNHYTYHNPSEVENVCKICEALNDEAMMKKTTIYKEFRSWWNSAYEKRCWLV